VTNSHKGHEPDDGLGHYFRVLADSAKMTASIAALGGFLLVALAKTGMDWFYGSFDLTPEEVGLDQSTILFQTAATAIVVLTISLLLGLGISAAATRIAGRRNKALATRSLPRLMAERRVLKRGGILAIILLTGYFLWGVETARQSIEAVKAGKSTSTQLLAHGQVVAWCVVAWWQDPRLNNLFGSPPGRRLVFFGQASGIAAFYDASTRRTVRIPIADVVMRSC
jgi:hypothetical protein